MAGERQDESDLQRRIGMFDTDGTLEESCREIWALIEPEKEAIARAYWVRYAQSDEVTRPITPEKIDELTARIIPHIEAKHGALADPAWVEMTRGYVEAATRANISLTTLFSGITACGQAVLDAVEPGGACRTPERLARLSRAVIALTALEIDVFSAHYDALRTPGRARAPRRPGHRVQPGDRQRRRAYRLGQPQGPRPGRRRQRRRARHARQDQRGRRRRRAERGGDARGRPDRGRPDHGDRGCAQRGRGRRRRRDPRRRPGERGGQGQPGACPPMSRRSNRSSA